MPMQQQQNSSFAKKLGVRVAAANEEHRDKPVDTGDRRLPPGIRNGVAKLQAMYTKEYPDNKNGEGTQGQTFFRASASVLGRKMPDGSISTELNGEKIEGMITQQIISLCDMPAKGQRKAVSFTDNWYDFQNLFKLLGIAPPNETTQSDPTGAKTEAYYFAAMKTLTSPQRPPVYIEFSTRGWTPPATQAQPKPTEMVFETWHGLTELTTDFDPAAGVSEAADNGRPSGPPTAAPNRAAASAAPTQIAPPTPTLSVEDEVAMLVEVAMNDPEGATEEGSAASARLEELAWAAGATKSQTAGAKDWAEVAEMALGIMPNAAPIALPSTNGTGSDGPVVGSKWNFCKRTKEGAKLKNNKNEEFPPQEVEVTTVDVAAKTCTVKTTKDGKDVVDIRSKAPVAVRFEWLEAK